MNDFPCIASHFAMQLERFAMQFYKVNRTICDAICDASFTKLLSYKNKFTPTRFRIHIYLTCGGGCLRNCLLFSVTSDNLRLEQGKQSFRARRRAVIHIPPHMMEAASAGFKISGRQMRVKTVAGESKPFP